jgi:hypothetical protein
MIGSSGIPGTFLIREAGTIMLTGRKTLTAKTRRREDAKTRRREDANEEITAVSCLARAIAAATHGNHLRNLRARVARLRDLRRLLETRTIQSLD